MPVLPLVPVVPLVVIGLVVLIADALPATAAAVAVLGETLLALRRIAAGEAVGSTGLIHTS